MNTRSFESFARTPATGCAEEAVRLLELDAALVTMLGDARKLADKAARPGDWSVNWDRLWERAAGALRRMRGLLREMNGFVERGSDDDLRRAMEVWKSIQTCDVEMSTVLDAIRSHASGMNAEAREAWDAVDAAMTAHLETVHAFALALRVKLELMKDYTQGEVNHLLEGMLARLPNPGGAGTADAEEYVQKFRETLHELDEERHEFGGFMDFIKGLAMWVETPDERMKKKMRHETDWT